MRIIVIENKNQKKRDWNQTLYILPISIGGPNYRNPNFRTGKFDEIFNKSRIKKLKDWHESSVYN